MEFIFGYHIGAISECVNWMFKFILKKWDFLLRDFASGHLSKERLSLFARKIHEKGAPLDQCWGFIDCTICQIYRPKKWQQGCYNGYKHLHALKYSAVKSPDGLVYHLYGPWEGQRNDNVLLRESLLLDCYHEFAPDFYMFGDPTYSLSNVLLSPYSHLTEKITDKQRMFNLAMSSCQEAVE